MMYFHSLDTFKGIGYTLGHGNFSADFTSWEPYHLDSTAHGGLMEDAGSTYRAGRAALALLTLVTHLSDHMGLG